MTKPSYKVSYALRVKQFRRIMKSLSNGITFYTLGDDQHKKYRKQNARRYKAMKAWRKILPGLK